MSSLRSRIDGVLHRSLPAQISIRAAEDGQADDGLLRLRLSVSSETPYLRSSWWDDPWIEVLGHQDGEVDLTRLNDGAAALANHDRWSSHGNTPLAGIGAVERAWIEGTRLMCDIAISRREALADLRQDIADGLVRNVSIGYLINERVLVKAGEGQPSEYRVTSWTPFEVSLVDIPADASVGLGRSAQGDAPESSTRRPGYRVIDIPPAEGATQRNGSMPTEDIQTPPAGTQAPAQPAGARSVDPLAAERERAREILALGRTFGLVAEADAAIDAGTTLDAFRALVLDKQRTSGQLRTAESPEIGMSERDVKQFSFLRALLAAADPAHARDLAPFELECSRAAQAKRSDMRKDREAAITIPIDVLRRGIELPEEAAARAARELIGRAQRTGRDQFRALNTGTPTAGGNSVATELMGSSFIELLRNVMVLDRLGITWLRDLNGNVAIPSATGAAQYYWVTEGNAPTVSQQTMGQVVFTPKTIAAMTDYSRRLLLQSSIDVEAFVRADLAAIIGLGIQYSAFHGAGTGGEILGLFNTSGIGSVPGGANGAAPVYDHVVDLESSVANANADVGNLAYVTNSRVRGKLRKTQEFTGTNGKAIWQRGRESGIGDVLGYDAYVTNTISNTLTKGTSTGVCSAIAYGNWADMVIAMWGGLDVMLDPYTFSSSGTKRVVALQDVDMQLRQVASFAAMKDALTA